PMQVGHLMHGVAEALAPIVAIGAVERRHVDGERDHDKKGPGFDLGHTPPPPPEGRAAEESSPPWLRRRYRPRRISGSAPRRDRPTSRSPRPPRRRSVRRAPPSRRAR